MSPGDRYIAFLIKTWLKVEALSRTKWKCLLYLDITEDTHNIHGSYVQQHVLRHDQETDTRNLRSKVEESALLSALTALGFVLIERDANSYIVEYQDCYVGRIYVKEIYRVK